MITGPLPKIYEVRDILLFEVNKLAKEYGNPQKP
jgi:hypothetical protein